MSKISIFIIVLFLFNNCSFNENSKIWKNKDNNKVFENSESVKKLFVEEEVISKEFNSELATNIKKINYSLDHITLLLFFLLV